MSINEFYAMFVSTEESALFSALRKLASIDDPRILASGDPDDPYEVWTQWTVSPAASDPAAEPA